MKSKVRKSARRLCTWGLRAVCLLTVAGLLAFAAATPEAEADSYDPQKAGHPLRITAYLLHPVGVLIDYGLMRPCFWVVKREPFASIFGYKRPMNEDAPE
jgi:hypothetical protein